MMKYFYSTVSLLVLTFALGFASPSYAQETTPNRNSPPTVLTLDQKPKDFQIKLSEENSFIVELEKDKGYLITVEQKGIDLVVRLTDTNGNLIKEQDSPNGNDGPEKIFFEPDNNGRFFVSVKPLQKPKNPPAGGYSIRVSRVSGGLTAYRLEALEQDFDLLVSSLKEAHTGLNWYSTYREFDDFCANQRKLLRDRMRNLISRDLPIRRSTKSKIEASKI